MCFDILLLGLARIFLLAIGGDLIISGALSLVADFVFQALI